MAFYLTVYYQTIVIFLLYSFGDCFESGPIDSNLFGEEHGAFIQMGKHMNDIVTWKSKTEWFAVTVRQNEEEDVQKISKRINDTMYDLQCTYAYLAKTYVDIIVNSLILEKIELLQQFLEMKELYIETASKVKQSFVNFAFKPPLWLNMFLTYLRGQDIAPKFLNGLEGITKFLTDEISTSTCNREQISKYIGNFGSIAIALMSENHSKYVDFLTEIKHDDHDSFSTLYLIGTNFILNENRHILSYKETPAFPWYLTVDFLKKNPIHNISPLPTNGNYTEEFREIDLRVNRGFPLLNITIWLNPIDDEDIDFVCQKPDEVNVNSHRERYAVFNGLKDNTMNRLHCAYAHYANIHIKETLRIFKLTNRMPNEHDKNEESNAELAFKYFDIALMTLATFYNKNFYPPGWLVLLVVYLENVRTLYQDKVRFEEHTVELLKDLDYACWKCDRRALPKKFTIPLREIQTEYKHETSKRYTIWQIELTAIQSADPERGNYVWETYQNLIQIEYFLDVNSNMLNYSNYQEFHPSKWLTFESMAFNKDLFNSIRWDTLPYEHEHSSWDISTSKMLTNKQFVKDKIVDDGRTRITNSIYNQITIHMAAVVLRLITSFLIQCNSIRESNSFQEISNHFVQHCTGMAKLAEQVCEISGLKERDFFFIELLVELNDYEKYIRNKNEAISQFTIDLIERYIVKLQDISLEGGLESYIPIVPISASGDNLKMTESASVWSRINQLKEMIKQLEMKFKTDFQSMVDYIHMHNVLVNAVDLEWPYAISIEKS